MSVEVINVALKELSRDARAGNVFEHRRDTALRLFAENGFKQVTMRDLAQRVGLKAGSIYHYFESKEQLLFEFLEAVYDALLLPNRRASTVTATTSSARLQSFVISHIQVYRSIPLHFQLLEKERRNLTGAYDAALTSMQRSTRRFCTTSFSLWSKVSTAPPRSLVRWSASSILYPGVYSGRVSPRLTSGESCSNWRLKRWRSSANGLVVGP